MQSNYKQIGDYIQLVDERNKGLSVKQLLGLSISKQFIPSVANIIGTDMENYKIIRKNQFACSTMQVRRDKKMPVALLQEVDEAIISQAYPIFEVKDEKELLPEYLMMWFSREEFDREACFHAVGGVRGSLEWDDFCTMKFPLPSPEKQSEIVAEYNTVKNRIELNKRLIQKLEETAQAIYKQWFVEFEFPDENGKPYKSSGGEMVECELGAIPVGWEVGTLEDLYKFQYGLGNRNPDNNGKYPIYGAGGVIGGYDKYNSEDAPVIGHMGEYCGAVVFAFGKHYVTYNGVMCLAKTENLKWFCYLSLLSKDLMSHTRGSSQPFVSYDMLYEVQTIIPNHEVAKKFDSYADKIFININLILQENQKLTELKDLLLSKLATIKN
ncbi:type I restriction enzyme S subunit [Breznakibacter xylanolyticus]|uniref:Type I restriction enzyme S subunit n=1 Tax=Breznakibacter xylanolyticus TaxID=990 RepID=A0A2W7MWM4_9BACT|nr:restriction endonuclease subunit S [Breznakibacter xylanolyticus]PZX10547.1 type I restriction enzyme S subunit [Breznakibacter xylanolyticus]